MIISRKECQRGEFKVTKVVVQHCTEVPEIQHRAQHLSARSCRTEESMRVDQQGGTTTLCWVARPPVLGGTAMLPSSRRRDLSYFSCNFREMACSLFFSTREQFLKEIFRVFERILFHVFRLNSSQLKIVLPFNNN